MADHWTTAQIPSQSGKTVLITGANSGIGMQAAWELARHGARVLLGVRSVARGEQAAATIRQAVPSADVQPVALDMASLASVRAFAEGFRGPLDVLVNNAGVMALPQRELTEDGFERQFGTNHLGHFALTGVLLPRLLETADPRVVTVASLAHRNGKIAFDNLQSERAYKPWDAYNASKLANLMFARELDRRSRAAGMPLRSVAVHPGVSRTNIVKNGPGLKDPKTLVLFLFGRFLTQDDAAGALPTLYAATAPEAQGGQYIGPDGLMEFRGAPKVVEPMQPIDAGVQRQLWDVSEELTGVRYPGLG